MFTEEPINYDGDPERKVMEGWTFLNVSIQTI